MQIRTPTNKMAKVTKLRINLYKNIDESYRKYENNPRETKEETKSEIKRQKFDNQSILSLQKQHGSFGH